MIELQRCHKRSAAKIALVLGVATYLICGILLILAYAGVRSVLLHSFPALGVSTVSFFLFWFGGTLPVALLSYCFGLLLAAVYNLSTRWWGGLRFDLGRIGEEPQQGMSDEHKTNATEESQPALPKQAVRLMPRHTMRISKPERTNYAETTDDQEG